MYADQRPDVQAEEARVQAEIAQQEAAQQAGHAAPGEGRAEAKFAGQLGESLPSLPLSGAPTTDLPNQPSKLPRLNSVSGQGNLDISSQGTTEWRVSNPALANRLSKIAFVLDLTSLFISATGAFAEIAATVIGGVAGGIGGAVEGAIPGFIAYPAWKRCWGGLDLD